MTNDAKTRAELSEQKTPAVVKRGPSKSRGQQGQVGGGHLLPGTEACVGTAS